MFGARWVYASCDVSMAKGVTCAVYGARLRPVNVTKGSAVGKFLFGTHRGNSMAVCGQSSN